MDNRQRSERDGIRRVREAGHASRSAARHQVRHGNVSHALHETMQVCHGLCSSRWHHCVVSLASIDGVELVDRVKSLGVILHQGLSCDLHVSAIVVFASVKRFHSCLVRHQLLLYCELKTHQFRSSLC